MQLTSRPNLTQSTSLSAIRIALLLAANGLVVNAQAETELAQSLPPVSVFSSFLSEESSKDCSTQECVDDFIPADTFFEVVTDTKKFVQAAASQDGFDYEILIANTLKTATDMPMVTEIDVTWRGIPISSYQFSVPGISPRINDARKRALAEKTIDAFFEQSQQDQVFSAEFLFRKLKASDYKRDLKLPAMIDAFFLEDMQLYRDPFQGAVARYSHPDYTREVLDVFVYPSIVHSENNKLDTPLKAISEELNRDIDDIQLVAKARNIGDISISDIKRIDWHTEQRHFSGYYFDVEAEDSEGEPLFTTTYLFKEKDKFIKFSANFPDRIAHPMVRSALPQISVPEPSDLMQSLRNHKG